MSVYSSFPRIPHLEGSAFDVDDVVLDAESSKRWLQREVRAFEKLDGINVTFQCVGRGHVRFAVKDEWQGALGGRLERAIEIWMLQHKVRLQAALKGGAHLYGEWLWHKISVGYRQLPAPLLGIAFRDERGRLLPFDLATERICAAGVVPTRPLYSGVVRTRQKLKRLAKTTAFGAEQTEGLILEAADTPYISEEDGWAKWVRSDYQHPRRETLTGEKNVLEWASR